MLFVLENVTSKYSMNSVRRTVMHISIYAVAIRRTVRRIILDLSYSPDENYLGSGWVHASV